MVEHHSDDATDDATLTEYLSATDNTDPSIDGAAAITYVRNGAGVWQIDDGEALADDPAEYRVECSCGATFGNWGAATEHAEEKIEQAKADCAVRERPACGGRRMSAEKTGETAEIAGKLVVGSAVTGESHSATATIRPSIERSDFHDDGRRVVCVVGTMHIDGADCPITFRAGSSDANVDDRSALPEAVRPDEDWRRVGFKPADCEAETLKTVRQEGRDRRNAENDETLDQLAPTVSAGDSTRHGGSGEGSEIRAEGEIEVADGRTVGVTWRNIFDAGHATHLDEGDLTDFEDLEVDALASFATERSPITRRTRM